MSSLVQRPTLVATHRIWWLIGAVLAVGMAMLAILTPSHTAPTAAFTSISTEPAPPVWALFFVENLGWMLVGLFTTIIFGAFSLDRGLRADAAQQWHTHVVPPLRVAVRPFARHWQMSCITTATLVAAGTLWLNVEQLAAAAMTKPAETTRNDNVFFTTSAADWRGWELKGVVVTNNGTIQLAEDHSNAKWVPDLRAPKEQYTSIFELDANHVWFGANGPYLVYYNGAAYEHHGILGVPNTRAMWGSDTNKVWALTGALMGTFRYNGNSWQSDTGLPADIRDIDGTSSNDIWAVGDVGSVYHSDDGTNWASNKPSDKLGCPFEWVKAFAHDDVVVAGATGVMFRWNGSSWTMITGPLGAGSLEAIWGHNSRTMTIRSVNGNAYHTQDGGKTWQTSKAAIDPDRHWKLDGGKIYRFTGSRYTSGGEAVKTFTTDHRVEWQNATTQRQGLTQTLFSTNGKQWAEQLDTLPRSDRLTVKIKLTTPNRQVTPTVQSFSLGYAP